MLVGSGANGENARDLGRLAEGLIVGTWFKKDGNVLGPVDPERVKRFMAQLGR